jgi:hypothetical protein
VTDRPIIFSAPMIRALLDGRKTQTRRVLKPSRKITRLGYTDPLLRLDVLHGALWWWDGIHECVGASQAYPYATGDRLWVREAFRYDAYPPLSWSHWPVHYEADGNRDTREGMGADSRLRSPIHMPRWASRLTLIVTDVRVQRLQEIDRGDAMDEGCPFPNMAHGKDPRHWFNYLWNSLHGPDAWDANPWVVALTFTVHRCNIDQVGME